MSIAAAFAALFRRNDTECEIHHLPKVERTAGETKAFICLECLRENKERKGFPMPSFDDEFKNQQALGMRLVELLAANAEEAIAEAAVANLIAHLPQGEAEEKPTTIRIKEHPNAEGDAACTTKTISADRPISSPNNADSPRSSKTSAGARKKLLAAAKKKKALKQSAAH